MKFAKEIDQELVPEWRVKYFNYKASRDLMTQIFMTPEYVDMLSRREKRKSKPQGQAAFDPASVKVNGPQKSRLRGHTAMHATPATIPEQRPLRPSASPFSGPPGSYGSIFSEPPNTASSDLSSIRLPDPAIDPEQLPPLIPVKEIEPSHGEQFSSTVQTRSKQKANLPSHEEAFRKKAALFRRVLVPAFESPGKSSQDSMFSDLDKKRDDFFAFLDEELRKIESFYRQKEQEATDRLKLLRQQLRLMRDQRTEEVLLAREPRDHATTTHDAFSVLNRPKWTKMISGKTLVGKNSKALLEMRTPAGPRSQDQEDFMSRRDFARRLDSQKVPYRSAKRKLKLAMQEYYRGLELLKAYAYLNRKAFRKINKKYDKAVDARPTLRYMSEKVNKSYFVQSEVIEGHMVVVEDLYARCFERGNRKIAVGKLRGKSKPDDYSPSTFRSGLLVATGAVFSVQGLVHGVQLLKNDPDPTVRIRVAYLLQLYAGFFLIVFHSLLFCLDCAIWSQTKINYTFVFEYDARHVLDWRQLLEFPSCFFFLLGVFIWSNFSWINDMFIYWPVVLISVTIVILFFPAKILYHQSRKWWAYSNWRLLLAGMYPVEFRDFFLGDMYCSQTYSMGNIASFFCLYGTGWGNPDICNSSHSRLLGFLTTLPSIWRSFQCLRRYYDTRNAFPHLVNLGKYALGILYYMNLSLYRINKATHYQVLFILFAFLNSTYCFVWDVAMDWSLCDPHAQHPFLRDILVFRPVWVYYAAMCLDVVIRFNWILFAILVNDIQHSAVLSFYIAFSEIWRRGMWTVFRVENEHCANVHMYRALRDVPLPYDIPLHDPIPGDEISLDGQLQPQGRSTTAVSIDMEYGAGQEWSPATVNHRSPAGRKMSRVGTLMATAHSQDFQRRKQLDPVSGAAGDPESQSAEETTDDDTESPSVHSHRTILDEELPSSAVYRTLTR
ncbi:hypothetical protein Egran_06289 [Elaphomyces granulatus]|uniref:SPX domain-containing protein n=1 Tax=Elaphomyces granulatus TaxID=519963 RepID=A0A232LP61_9EURO|nr:hypothetical protein Egran_06289 [Elaphomyces granulatus]